MSLAELREQVAAANRGLASAGLVALSFGNASGVDRERDVLVIKPSGVPCADVGPEHMVLVSLRDGSVVEGSMRPSSDTPTHRVLYRRFAEVGGVVHTHSPFATAWAQARRPIPCLGTTHADHFTGPIPVTRALTPQEIAGAYEHETGEVIASTLDECGVPALAMPAVLVAAHGPFTWGTDAADAVANAATLEVVAGLAWRTLALASNAQPIDEALSARHFSRKHGPAAYYGQPDHAARPR